MNRRFLMQAVCGLALFLVWTVAERQGITNGSRHSVNLKAPFGVWPPTVAHVQGSSKIELSIFATYAEALAPPSSEAAPNIVGQATIGTTIDSSDSENINGSRFVTGLRAGAVRAISVFVAGPIDRPPHDQFELAIYEDSRGAPARLLATTNAGALTPDAWNSLDIHAVLKPRAAYWMMYNTNGTNGAVNNPTYSRRYSDLIEDTIYPYRTKRVFETANWVIPLGGNVPTAVAVSALAIMGMRQRLWTGAAILICYALGLLIALVLRETVFAPYSLYPSGHALRTSYVATVLTYLVSRRSAHIAGILVVLCVGVASLFTYGHHANEVVGGILLGWSAATAARTLVVSEPDHASRSSTRVGRFIASPHQSLPHDTV